MKAKIDDVVIELMDYLENYTSDLLNPLSVRIAEWYIFGKKSVGEYMGKVNELLRLFRYNIRVDDVVTNYNKFLVKAYLIGSKDAYNKPYQTYRADTNMMIYLSQHAQEIMHKHFENVSEHLRITLIDQITKTQNWQQVGEALEKTLNFSKMRAKTIARTELHRAAVNGKIIQYEKEKVKKVRFVTKSGACYQCDPLNGKIYTLTQAMGTIPVHPNCRCDWELIK